jgi:hypothetical protein
LEEWVKREAIRDERWEMMSASAAGSSFAVLG